MGDAPDRNHRRSVIVSSSNTTSKEHYSEDSELASSPTARNVSPSDSLSPDPSPPLSSSMYGPTVAIVPQHAQPHHFHSQYTASHPRYNHGSVPPGPIPQQSFNMQAVHSALPNYPMMSTPHQHRYGPVASGHPIQYNVPAPVHSAAISPQPYNTHQYAPPGGYYDHFPAQNPQGNQGSGAYTMQPSYSPTYSPAPQVGMNQMPMQYSQWPQPIVYYSSYGQPSATYPTEYGPSSNYGGRRGSFPATEPMYGPMPPQSYDPNQLSVNQRPGNPQKPLSHHNNRQRRGSPVSSVYPTSRSNNSMQSLPSSSGTSIKSNQSTLHPAIPRGPPRKPRQSGHALWVGNLPPGVTVSALKDYFATDQIESVFLISKSNCAFVNYKTEASCNDAMTKFHDSRFQGVRLVCRLRRSSSPGGETSDQEVTSPDQPSQPSDFAETEEVSAIVPATAELEIKPARSDSMFRGGKERYFIVKSLTVEDLDTSVSNGIWATQTHNETTLNEAFLTADHVFLVFSANKSGEYYGYARMTSEISDEIASKIEWAPMTQSIDETALPKAIYTPPTDNAPRGRIIDDSSRGTIFWEVVEDSDTEDEETPIEGTTISKAWGKPFRVEWVSTTKVPFYRTRGLRNPYNVSREVKIARDGTELEPSVGKKLLQMFHRGGPLPFENESASTEPNTPSIEKKVETNGDHELQNEPSSNSESQ